MAHVEGTTQFYLPLTIMSIYEWNDPAAFTPSRSCLLITTTVNLPGIGWKLIQVLKTAASGTSNSPQTLEPFIDSYINDSLLQPCGVWLNRVEQWTERTSGLTLIKREENNISGIFENDSIAIR